MSGLLSQKIGVMNVAGPKVSLFSCDIPRRQSNCCSASVSSAEETETHGTDVTTGVKGKQPSLMAFGASLYSLQLFTLVLRMPERVRVGQVWGFLSFEKCL